MQEKSLAYFCNKSNVTAFEHKGNGRIFDNNEVTYQFNASEISKVSKDLQKLRNPVALGSWLSCPCALDQVKKTFVTITSNILCTSEVSLSLVEQDSEVPIFDGPF